MNQERFEYEIMRELAEAELERRIDKSLYYQDLLDCDESYQEWLAAIQSDNLEYQMENDHEHV